ncbi:MAG: hypothetical protein QOE72_1878 [Chloroflexota bacterium]|jgi:DNA-binding transcriptional regulator GbsR (MarR family)|nr:hypothetical protein [Chloroflexota bacterium]
MAPRKRKSIIDRWQTVIDETKGLVDDQIARLRSEDEEDELEEGVKELKQAVSDLNAKLDRLAREAAAHDTVPGKSTSKTA